MKTLILFILGFLPFLALSSHEVLNNDVLFYNNDTLYVSKIFSEKILRKIKHQKNFKDDSGQIKANHYTAFWKIENNQLYLIKVTNYQYFGWDRLSKNDTLDLKKAFGLNYKNGKVKFHLFKKTIFAHQYFVLRQPWNWIPTYLEDYTIYFKKGRLSTIDTTVNYINDPTRLNRYSHMQMDGQLIELLSESINIAYEIPYAKQIKFTLIVTITNDGAFKEMEIGDVKVTNMTDYTYTHHSTSDIIETKPVKELLKSVLWDKIFNTEEDKVYIQYVYDVNSKKITTPEYDNYVSVFMQSELKHLPGFLKAIYDK
jgi:hypothetical protein